MKSWIFISDKIFLRTLGEKFCQYLVVFKPRPVPAHWLPSKNRKLERKMEKKKNWENVGKKCRTSWNVLVVCGHDHFQLTGLPLKLPVSATGREEVNREGNVWECGDSLRENCEKLPLRKTVEILYKRKVCKVFFKKKLRFSTRKREW